MVDCFIFCHWDQNFKCFWHGVQDFLRMNEAWENSGLSLTLFHWKFIEWYLPVCLHHFLESSTRKKHMVTSSIGAIFVIILINSFWLTSLARLVSWCSWLSRQSNTLKVSGSSPGDAILSFFSLFLTLAVICWSWFSICCELYALHRRMNCNSLIWTVCW